MILAIYLGCLYFFFGIMFLLIPLVYIELGRPRDFLKGGLNLFIGMLLIIKHNVFNPLYYSIIILTTILISFYLVEISSIRWHQLTNQEKNKLKTLGELKKNLLIFFKAISFAIKDFLSIKNIFKLNRKNENLNKKWVRNDENDNIITSDKNNLVTLEMPTQTTKQSEKDTIAEWKNNF